MSEEKSAPAKSTKSAAPRAAEPDVLGGETGHTLADVQGEYLTPDDPAQTPGTPEHLGSDPLPYAGAPPE